MTTRTEALAALAAGATRLAEAVDEYRALLLAAAEAGASSRRIAEESTGAGWPVSYATVQTRLREQRA